MTTRNQKGFLKSLALLELGIFEVFFVGIVIALILLVLNFFNIISLSTLYPDKLGWLPQRLASQTAKTNNSIFGCPLLDTYCKELKEITYKGNPALAITAPSGTSVRTVNPTVDSLTFFEQPYKETNPKGLYQSFILNNLCYTATYTVPNDSGIRKIDLLPLARGEEIATVGAGLIPVNKNNYNFVFQMQKRQLGAGQYDFQKCSVKQVESKDFGQYEKLNQNIFN